jgi:hypothetical protein
MWCGGVLRDESSSGKYFLIGGLIVRGEAQIMAVFASTEDQMIEERLEST